MVWRRCPNVGLKMTAEAVGAGIVERELNDPTLRYGVLDPACFREDGGPSIAERINKVDPSAPAPIPRCRQFPRASARVDGGLGSAAFSPSRPRWPAHDLLLQHTRCEHQNDPGPPTRSGAARGREYRVRGPRGGRGVICVHVSAVRAGARGTHDKRAGRGIRRIPLGRGGGLEAVLIAEPQMPSARRAPRHAPTSASPIFQYIS